MSSRNAVGYIRRNDGDANGAPMPEADLGDQGVTSEAAGRFNDDGLDAVDGDAAQRFGEAGARVERVSAAHRRVIERLDDLETCTLCERLDGALLTRERLLVGADARR